MCVVVSQAEIEGLYVRFRALDRGQKVSRLPISHAILTDPPSKPRLSVLWDALAGLGYAHTLQGYISAEEFLNIPELSINPLARRLERLFDTVNFKVAHLPFHSRPTITYTQAHSSWRSQNLSWSKLPCAAHEVSAHTSLLATAMNCAPLLSRQVLCRGKRHFLQNCLAVK